MKTISNHSEKKSVFSITDFAKEYLYQHCRPSNSSFIKVNRRIKELKALGQSLSINVEVNPYNPTSITYQSNSDQIIAAYNLKQALVCSGNSDYEKSYMYIERAKDIDPNYFEIYKVSGFIYSRSVTILKQILNIKLRFNVSLILLHYYFCMQVLKCGI